jgi:hypothetical protein
MKVGLFVTNQQQLATDMDAALDDQIAMVELARDRGWNSLFTGQHYLNEGYNKQLQAVPFLARLTGKIITNHPIVWVLVGSEPVGRETWLREHALFSAMGANRCPANCGALFQ